MMPTDTEMRAAITRCMQTPVHRRDQNIAGDLLRNLNSGSTPEQIAAADAWFNKRGSVLDWFMGRYGSAATPGAGR